MTKKLTPKQQLQADYKEAFGKEADPKITAVELEKLLSDKGEKGDPEKDEKVTSKKSWVNDRNLIDRVEGTRQSIALKDEKGKVIGGTEYYGVLKPVKSK